MIDFRYHLVSLISVFLALAVGIALGAGPLKESIGDTLTGQVEQLRAEKESLRAQSELATGRLEEVEKAVTALGPSIVAGTLGGRRVALVVVGEVDGSVTDAVSTSINRAGGVVTAVATVTDAWTDPGRTAFVQSLAGTLVQYLDTKPADDAGARVELAEALVQSLSTADPTDPDVLSSNAGVALDLLGGGDEPLVTLDDPVSVPADAVLILAGPITPETADGSAPTAPPAETTPADRPSGTASASPSAEQTDRVAAWTEIAAAAQRRTAGAVVATGNVTDDGLVHAVRASADLAGTLSTVDGVGSPIGTVATPLALVNRIAGTVGQYGSGWGANAPVPPRVMLPEIVRTAAQPSAPPAGGATPPVGGAGVPDPSASTAP